MNKALSAVAAIAIHLLFLFSLPKSQGIFLRQEAGSEIAFSLKLPPDQGAFASPSLPLSSQDSLAKKQDNRSDGLTRSRYLEPFEVDLKPELISNFELHSKNIALSEKFQLTIAIYISNTGNVDFVLPATKGIAAIIVDEVLFEASRQRFLPATKDGKAVPSVLYVDLEIDGYQLTGE